MVSVCVGWYVVHNRSIANTLYFIYLFFAWHVCVCVFFRTMVRFWNDKQTIWLCTEHRIFLWEKKYIYLSWTIYNMDVVAPFVPLGRLEHTHTQPYAFPSANVDSSKFTMHTLESDIWELEWVFHKYSPNLSNWNNVKIPSIRSCIIKLNYLKKNKTIANNFINSWLNENCINGFGCVRFSSVQLSFNKCVCVCLVDCFAKTVRCIRCLRAAWMPNLTMDLNLNQTLFICTYIYIYILFIYTDVCKDKCVKCTDL